MSGFHESPAVVASPSCHYIHFFLKASKTLSEQREIVTYLSCPTSPTLEEVSFFREKQVILTTVCQSLNRRKISKDFSFHRTCKAAFASELYKGHLTRLLEHLLQLRKGFQQEWNSFPPVERPTFFLFR